MNDEIKEIDNSDLMELLETTSKKDFYRLTLDHELVVRLYNWITNLQQEKEDYKSRCEKANKFIKEKISSTQGVINDYMYHKEHNKILIELLQEDIEMYKKELNILNGGDEE